MSIPWGSWRPPSDEARQPEAARYRVASLRRMMFRAASAGAHATVVAIAAEIRRTTWKALRA